MSTTESISHIRIREALGGRIGRLVVRGRQDAPSSESEAWSAEFPGAHAWVNGRLVGEMNPRLAPAYRSHD